MKTTLLTLIVGILSQSAFASDTEVALKQVCEGEVYKLLLKKNCYRFHSVELLGDYKADNKLLVDGKNVSFSKDGKVWKTETTCGLSASQNHVVLTQAVKYYGQIRDCRAVESVKTWIE